MALFYSVKNRHPFFSILILSSLSLHLWFFMSTTWQNITFPSRKMLLSSWVFEVTHICSKIEGGGCWLPPFLGNSNHFPLFFHLYPLFQFSSSIHIYWSDLTIRNCGIYHVHYLSPGFQSYSISYSNLNSIRSMKLPGVSSIDEIIGMPKNRTVKRMSL